MNSIPAPVAKTLFVLQRHLGFIPIKGSVVTKIEYTWAKNFEILRNGIHSGSEKGVALQKLYGYVGRGPHTDWLKNNLIAVRMGAGSNEYFVVLDAKYLDCYYAMVVTTGDKIKIYDMSSSSPSLVES